MSSFSPDGHFLAVCCKTHVAVIDVVQQEIHCDFDFKATIKDVEFSPDGRWLACANMSAGTVHLIDTRDFVEKQEPIKADSRGCGCVAFSPDSRLVAAGGFDKRVKLFDVATGANVAEFDECPSYVVRIDFSPNGKRIVSASADGQVCIWNARTGDRLLNFDFSHGGYPKPEFSADGQSLVIGDHRVTKVLRAADVSTLSHLSVVELSDIACQLTIKH
jgi:WD40 repeat protein